LFITKLSSLSLRKGIIVVALLSGLFFGFRLGSYPLFVPDEARYSEIPREMLSSGDYVTPHLDGIKYLEKPPLFYWMQTGGLSLFGINEWGARSSNWLLGVLGCVLIYIAGYKWFSPRAGAWAATVLAVNVLYFGLVHIVTLDLALTFFVTTGLLSFLAAQQYSPGLARRLFCYAGFLSAALAVLTKGLVGIVLPGLIVFAWMLIRLNFSGLRHLYWPSGLLLFFLVAVPWHYMEQQINPEFFNYYFIEHHFKRYATDYAQRYKPWFFFIGVFILGALPWTIFFPKFLNKEAFKKGWQLLRVTSKESFLLCWLFIPILFFSVSQSKLVPYILPSFPALALLMGLWLSHFDAESKISRVAHYATAITAIALLITTWIFPFANSKSVKSFAEIMKSSSNANAPVMTYQHFYYDLPFYAQHVIPFVWHGGELRYEIAHSVVPHIVFDKIRFFTFIRKTQQPVWVVVKSSDEQEFLAAIANRYEIKGKTKRNTLILVEPLK
jgi:4-amino-4-deoxy-L-arabinose transferase-like glycosyltransferase